MDGRADGSPWWTVRVEGGSRDERERALLAAVEAGAAGAEEVDAPSPALVLHVETGAVEAVRRAAASVAPSLQVGLAEPTAEVEWSEAWQEGLEPILIGARLAIQPSFRPLEDPGDRTVLTVDPGQAFGTGGHLSTRLVLERLEAGASGWQGAEVLDVGCGTGVLALAALGLGATRGLGVDLDPLAIQASAENAARNGLSDRLALHEGPLETAPPGRFGLVVANMIRSELFPLLPALRARCAPGGTVILSGLLEEEEGRARARLDELGFGPAEAVIRGDERGDVWLVLEARIPA